MSVKVIKSKGIISKCCSPKELGEDVITKYNRDRKWTLEVGGEMGNWVSICCASMRI